MRALISSLLTLCLALPGAGPLASSQAWAAQKTSSRNTLLQARLRTLSLAVDFANEAPDAAERRLEQALESLHPFAPEIAASRESRLEQRTAGLTLARTQINNQRLTQAKRTLQELFLIDPPRESEFTAFGPSLTEQAKLARKEVENRPQGTVEIECVSSCAAYLNERRIPLVSNLPNGEYRLYIQDLSGETPALQERLELRGANATVRVRFDNKASPAQPTPLVTPRPGMGNVDRPSVPTKAPGRIAPMWLEVTGIAVGAGLIAGGAVMVHKELIPCARKNPDGSCRKDLRIKEGGIGMLIAGGAIFLTSTILLIVDGSRGKKRAKKLSQALSGGFSF